MTELRFYCFVNYYLSSIQQGVQTGHAAVDIVRKYTTGAGHISNEITPHKTQLVTNWADNHKTFITLNGGNAAGIAEATRIISNTDFPWVTFHEDEQSLGGIQTCVGVVLPESIFKAKANRASGEIVNFDFREVPWGMMVVMWPEHRYFELTKLVTGSGLAR